MQRQKNLTRLISTQVIVFLFLSPVILLSQVRTSDKADDIVAPGNPREEIYSPDGEYRLLDNGKLRILGHHKNKIKTGEFIYYNQYGQIERKENYLDNLLHGEWIEYVYGTPQSRREYYEGKKINYEYEFNYNDTTFIAGPYLKERFSKGVFVMRSKKIISMSNNLVNTRITYDTIFFEPYKPIVIHHYSFIKKSDKASRDFFATMELKTKSASHSLTFLESLVSRLKNYVPHYFPSTQNCLTKYYNESGKLIFRSDSGYAVNYFPNGQLKDSLCIFEEGKVCRTGYNRKGDLLYVVRMDKTSPRQTTNLYYDKNKTLIYEISAINDKPRSLKIHSDSIKNIHQNGVLTDCFETHYFYNPATWNIDSSMTRTQFKYRNRERIPDGRYFFIAPKGKKKRMYRFIEINGNYCNDENTDSTLARSKSKGAPFEMFRNDSIIYLVSDNYYYKSDPKEEKYLIRKFLLKNGKLYIVHSRVNRTNVSDAELMFLGFEADTLPNLKTELIAEKDFMKVLDMKPIRSMSKKEYAKWIKRCEAIAALNEKNKSLFVGNSNYYYTVESLRRIYRSEFYLMGYNPYVNEEEYTIWLQSLKLNEKEYEKALKFLQ